MNRNNRKSKRFHKYKTKYQLFKREAKKHKAAFTVYIILRALVILIAAVAFLRGDYQNFFLCILSLILFLLPAFVSKNFGIRLPETLQIIVLFFIFASQILGEISGFYVKISIWDSLLHGTTGFLAAAIGFALIDILNRTEKIKFRISPIYMAVVAFCFSMTVGVVWEFFEFSMDWFFRLDMQKDHIIQTISSVSLNDTPLNEVVQIENITKVLVETNNGTLYDLSALGINGYLDIGIVDTMKDLFVNMIGAFVFSVIGFFYIKQRGRGKFAKKFIPTLADEKKQKPD